MSVENYYDIRGQWRLESQAVEVGPQAIPTELRAPYIFAENVIKNRSPKGLLLDFCCGDGIHSIRWAELGYSVSGVDLSSKSIEAAQWLAERHQVQQACQFRSGDAMQFLLGRSAEFDVIFISGSLYYFDLDQIMPAIVEALKPGGTFVCIGTNGDNFLANLYRRTKQAIRNYRDPATMDRLLRNKDWQKMKNSFANSQLYFFTFLSLFTKAMPPWKPLKQGVARTLEFFDSLLLRLPFFWRLGFKYVFIGTKDV